MFRSLEPMANFHNQMGASRSILTMDGVDHVTMRKVQAKGYSANVAKDSGAEIVDIARAEIAEWPVGKPFEALPAFQNLIAEQMGHMMTGLSPRGYTKDLTTLLGGLLLSSAVFPHVMKLPRFRRARESAFELAEKVLAHKERNGRREGKPDFLDLMLELRSIDPQLVPETNMPLNVVAPYMVGLDTTASTCSFMLYNVLKHPDLMERMTAEADAFFERDLKPGEGLRRLDVSRRAVMETLRLHPVSPAVLRTVANSFEFAGHTVPAGRLVMIGTAVGHGLEEYFPQPERFDIGRYTQDRGEHRQRGAYAPFGAGQPPVSRKRSRSRADRPHHGDHSARACSGAPRSSRRAAGKIVPHNAARRFQSPHPRTPVKRRFGYELEGCGTTPPAGPRPPSRATTRSTGCGRS